MNKQKLNQENSFLVLNEETLPVIEKLDELVEELIKIETQEELLQKLQQHTTHPSLPRTNQTHRPQTILSPHNTPNPTNNTTNSTHLGYDKRNRTGKDRYL